MSFCQSCGNKIDKDASFCSKCGAKQVGINNQIKIDNAAAKSSHSGIQDIISIAIIFGVLMYVLLGIYLSSKNMIENKTEINSTAFDTNNTEVNATDVVLPNDTVEQNQSEAIVNSEANISENTDLMSDANIETFLTKLLNSGCFYSENNVSEYYVQNVKRYFIFNNPTHKDIFDDNVKYCQRWTIRNYQLNSYSIINKYNDDGAEYVDLIVDVGYEVSNGIKNSSGISKQFMTLSSENGQIKVEQSYATK